MLIASATAWAQQAAPAPRQPAPAAKAPAQNPPDATAAATNAEQQGRVGRVQDLLGSDVVTQNGETFGTVDDIMINKKTGHVEFVLVATEQDSKDLFPIPWKTLAWYQGEDPKDQYLIIALTPQKFEQAPTIARQQWTGMTYSQWNTVVPQVSTFYGPVRPAEARAIRRAARTAGRVGP